MRHPSSIFFLPSLLLVITGCGQLHKSAIQQTTSSHIEKIEPLKIPDRVTIVIHGTLFIPQDLALTRPLKNALSLYLGTPVGIKTVDDLGNHAFADIARALNEADAKNFPLDSLYFFGWPGELHAKARMEAAHDLYQKLKDMHLPSNTPITLITHSHAGNVALLLAHIVQEKKDTEFTIDRLILLACPVQDSTENYIHSPIFKRAYNLYSPADIIQVLDPQGMGKKRTDHVKSFFSRRRFSPADNLVQAEIRYKRKAPRHLDFIRPSFMKQLPSLIHTLDDKNLREKLPSKRDGTFIMQCSR